MMLLGTATPKTGPLSQDNHLGFNTQMTQIHRSNKTKFAR